MMRAFSLTLLLVGWFLVLAAIAMLKPAFVGVFVTAGVAVEVLALALLARAQAVSASALPVRQERRY